MGKTLTVETIAEMYERPLYSVALGDLGTDPYLFEQRLQGIFDNAAKWNAFVSLEDAEVFFLSDVSFVQQSENLTRIALVSSKSLLVHT